MYGACRLFRQLLFSDQSFRRELYRAMVHRLPLDIDFRDLVGGRHGRRDGCQKGRADQSDRQYTDHQANGLVAAAVCELPHGNDENNDCEHHHPGARQHALECRNNAVECACFKSRSAVHGSHAGQDADRCGDHQHILGKSRRVCLLMFHFCTAFLPFQGVNCHHLQRVT